MGKNIDGGVIGTAYMDVMCESTPGDAWNGKYEYGISKATQPSLGCNVGLVMSELGHNAGSNHFLGCSTTFPPSAIGQIEDHMDGHVPNDGRTDGCWCEKMFYWPGGWPWWWKFPWVYWGPFKPADPPELDFPDVYELPPNELPPKEIPGLDVKPLPEEPQLEKDPLPEKEPNVPIDPRGPRPTIPPPQGKGPDVAGEVVCQSVMRRRRCNKAPGCEWEGPRKAK